MKGKELENRTYKPMFPYFSHLKIQSSSSRGASVGNGVSESANGTGSAGSGSSSQQGLGLNPKTQKGAFRVVCDTYVIRGDGTEIVHNAPFFGEDDLRVCLAKGRSLFISPVKFLPMKTYS